MAFRVATDMKTDSTPFGYDNFANANDFKRLEEQAEAGDEFAISVFLFAKHAVWQQKALEIRNILAVGYSELSFAEKERIFLDALENNGFNAYKPLEALYYENGKKDKFCKLSRQMFDTFGLAPISGNFVLEGYPEEVFNKLLTDCNIFDKKKTKQEILRAINTEEAKLISAQLYLRDGEHDRAFKMFNELSESDNLTIAVNADFCRGMMMYHGKADMKADRKTALKLLKDSMYNGYFAYISPAPEIRKIIIPKDRVIRTLLSSDVCREIYYEVK
jgi:hypothetical protein